MTKTKNNLVFDFWKNNLKANHFQLSIGQIVAKFSSWKDYTINENKERGQAWYEYYYGSQAVRCFLTDRESIYGLESTFENEQFDRLYELIRKYL